MKLKEPTHVAALQREARRFGKDRYLELSAKDRKRYMDLYKRLSKEATEKKEEGSRPLFPFTLVEFAGLCCLLEGALEDKTRLERAAEGVMMVLTPQLVEFQGMAGLVKMDSRAVMYDPVTGNLEKRSD